LVCCNRRCQLKRLEQHWLSQIVSLVSDAVGDYVQYPEPMTNLP
jgi:hypothetical protein